MESSPLEFIVIAEARADAQIACELADRVFVEDDNSPNGLEEDLLEHLRRWIGIEEGTDFMKWASLKKLARARRIGPIWHRKTGGPGSIDFAQARKAIILVQRLMNSRSIRALLLIRDLDMQVERKAGMEEARAEVNEDVLRVVIGAANPKREAWVLNGFEPETLAEDKSLAELRQDLGFNPCEWAERLTAKKDTAKRSARRVLGVLTGESFEREQKCWKETPLDLLKRRGEKTGLRDYLVEVEGLLPLLKQ